MKKLFIMAMAVVALTIASCTNKNEKAVEAEQPTVENALSDLQALIDGTDSTALQSALDAVKDKAAEFVNNVDPEAAKTYLEKVKELVATNADKIKALVGSATVGTVIDGIANLDVDKTVSDFVDAAKEAGVEAATDAAEAVDGAAEAVEDAKEAVENAPEAVKDAAVDAAKEKASETIDNAAEEAKKKLGL